MCTSIKSQKILKMKENLTNFRLNTNSLNNSFFSKMDFLKGISVLFIFLISSFFSLVKGQSTVDPKYYPGIFSKVDSIISKYVEYSSFDSEGADESRVINESIIENFKSLFSDNAKVEDELATQFVDGGTTLLNYLNVKERTIDEYIDVRKKNFYSDISVEILSSDVTYTYLSNGEVNIMLEKRSKARYKNSPIKVISQAKLMLTLKFSYDYKELKISGIRILDKVETDKIKGSRKLVSQIPGYKHDFDRDMDFIADKTDQDKDYPGLASGSGKPTRGEEQDLSRKLGIVFESKIVFDIAGLGGITSSSVEANNSMLNNYASSSDFANSNKAIIAPSITATTFGGRANVSYYVDRKSHFGFETGFQFLKLSGTITNDNLNFSYKSSDTTGEFRRTINTIELEEKISGTSLSIPFLVKYKNKISSKLQFEVAAGVNLNLAFSGTTNVSNVRIDYEGYYFDNTPGDKITNSIYTAQNVNNGGLFLTRDFYKNKKLDPVQYINDIADKSGLDVGLNKTPIPSRTINSYSFKQSIALVFRPQVMYKIDNNIYLTLGASFTINNFQNKQDLNKYLIADKVGNYNTLMNGFSNLKMNFTLLNLGLRYTIPKK